MYAISLMNMYWLLIQTCSGNVMRGLHAHPVLLKRKDCKPAVSRLIVTASLTFIV